MKLTEQIPHFPKVVASIDRRTKQHTPERHSGKSCHVEPCVNDLGFLPNFVIADHARNTQRTL